MNDTPETDVMVELSFHRINFPTAPVPAEFARKLERERDEAITARKESANEWLNAVDMADKRVARAKRERDEARFDLAFSRDLHRLQESQLDEIRNQLAETRNDCQMWKSEHSALVKALFEIADMADDNDPYFALDSIQDLLKKLGL